MPSSIGEIDRKPDGEPYRQANPGVQRKSEHQEHGGERAEGRDDPDRGRSERPLQAGIDDPQHQSADRDHGEGEQRSDTDELADEADGGSNPASMAAAMPEMMVAT